jgi:hypothetical protein
MTEGNLSLVKGSAPAFYTSVTGDTMTYYANLYIDVAAEVCSNKVLSFYQNSESIIVVDGDTINSSISVIPSFYLGTAFLCNSSLIVGLIRKR